MTTLMKLVEELQALLLASREDVGSGIAARSPALLAAHLLDQPVATLEHGSRCYAKGLSRIHALDFLRERLDATPGFELRGYDDEACDGFFLEVPVRRAPIEVGPDQHRETPVEFWAYHAGEGLVVRVEEWHDGDIDLDCWSTRRGAGVALIGEADRAVEGFTLVHGKALRLNRDGYEFLTLREPAIEPRQTPKAERAAAMVSRVVTQGAPGERIGCLWHGPPGNGKTSMVRRLLRETPGVTRLWVDPSALRSHNVESTFALLSRILRSMSAEEGALVLFEDVDLISGARGGDEIRTWLSALDGVEQFRCRIGFVGLTNISPKELDPAVVRPARLGDLIVEFGPPCRSRRRLILGDHLAELLEPSGLDWLAARTEGFSGAELELLCRRVRWARAGEPGPDEGADSLEALVAQVRPSGSTAPLGFART